MLTSLFKAILYNRLDTKRILHIQILLTCWCKTRVLFADDIDLVADNLQFWFDKKRASLFRDYIVRDCRIPLEMSAIRHLYCKRFMQCISVFNPLTFMSCYVQPNNATIVLMFLRNNFFYLNQHTIWNYKCIYQMQFPNTVIKIETIKR